MKYKQIDKRIDAIQFTRENIDSIVNFTNRRIGPISISRNMDGEMNATISNFDGFTSVKESDYIVKKREDKFTSISKGLFESTYEKVDRRMINIKLPVIPQLIEDQIYYLREELPELKSPYDILDHMVSFQYRDEDLDWIYESTENMDSFVLAWILGRWEVEESE